MPEQKYINAYSYCSVCRNQIQYFLHSWIITEFVTRLTRRVSLVEQVLLTLPEHLSSPLVFSGVRVAQSLVFCVMFSRSLFVHLPCFLWSLYYLSFFDSQSLIILYYLSFFDSRSLIISLVFSRFSYCRWQMSC